MKLNGKRPGAHIEPIVLPRPEGNLVFLAKAIESFDEFDKLCPYPTPPQKILPGKQLVSNYEEPEYKKQVMRHGELRLAYMVVKGLLDTHGLEWETVDLSDYRTWNKYREEFRASGLSDVEINRLVNGVSIANCLSEAAVSEARADFLAGRQAVLSESSSPNGEPVSTPSGEPAKDLS